MHAQAERVVHVGTGEHAYQVHIGGALLQQIPLLLEQANLNGTPRIVADRRVWELHGSRISDAFASVNRLVPVLTIDAGEDKKTLTVVSEIYDWLVEQRAERRDPILAFGGGVVGDMVGFAAATYLRGVPLVQIPTTLLAQVDSSVGGKTGVDHPRGKNLIGAFYDARVVISDIDVLSTLPRREVNAGLAEVVKMAAILDPDLFVWIEEHLSDLATGETAALAHAVGRGVELKGEVVTSDHEESGLRMILNYGHTLGHAIEAATGFQRYLHGEAVSIGMEASAQIAVTAGYLDLDIARRQRNILEGLGLPVRSEVQAGDLLPSMKLDKKTRAGRINWILLRGLGDAFICADVPETAVSAGIERVTSPAMTSQG